MGLETAMMNVNGGTMGLVLVLKEASHGMVKNTMRKKKKRAEIRAARAKKVRPRVWEGLRSSPREALRGLFSRGKEIKNSPLGKG